MATHCTDEIETTGADYGAAEIEVAQALLAAVGAMVGSLRAGIAACDNGFLAAPPALPTPPDPDTLIKYA